MLSEAFDANRFQELNKEQLLQLDGGSWRDAAWAFAAVVTFAAAPIAGALAGPAAFLGTAYAGAQMLKRVW